MPKYRNDENRKLKSDRKYIIPHGGESNEDASTVTIVEFSAGDSVRFVKTEMKKVLKALGLDRNQTRQYLKEAFNNFEDE